MNTCIHTIIKNELPEYLKAWLNHHTSMVDNIFIYEDIDSHSHSDIADKYDNVTLQSVLELFPESRHAELIENKKNGVINQNAYLKEGVSYIQSLNCYDWCFTLDIDEFITLTDGYKTIPDVLSEFNDHAAVLLQWQNIGASGHIRKPNYEGDYRKYYTEVCPDSEWDAKTRINTKICWNLNKITRWHLCGLHCCAGDWIRTNHHKNRRADVFDKMYLKHYITKSWEEYLWKLYVRGCHCYNYHRKENDFFQINKSMQDKYDECMEFKEKYLKENNIIKTF